MYIVLKAKPETPVSLATLTDAIFTAWSMRLTSSDKWQVLVVSVLVMWKDKKEVRSLLVNIPIQ